MSDDRQVFTADTAEDGSLALEGELDALTVDAFDNALAIRNGERDVTIDVSGLTFIDSSGLHAILEYVQSREPDGTVTLRGVSPHVLKLLEITRLTELPKLRIYG